MKSLRKIFNIVSAAALLASFYPLLFWNRLEGARIPTRFGMDGMPDRWGDMTSLLIIKSGAEMLRARDSMDQGKQINPEPEKEVV